MRKLTEEEFWEKADMDYDEWKLEKAEREFEEKELEKDFEEDLELFEHEKEYVCPYCGGRLYYNAHKEWYKCADCGVATWVADE